MRFKGTIIRPPSEADSYLLQVTYGCSHNKCTFCGTYLDKKFGVRPFEEVVEDINLAKEHFSEVRRVFLCDGNVMVLSMNKLENILYAVNDAFVDLQRIGLYANAKDVLSKSDDDLERLKDLKLKIVYMGLESGSEEILKKVKKGSSAEGIELSVRRLEQIGIKTSVIVILGLGGREKSVEHAVKSAEVASKMNPRFLSCLTLMLVPGTSLCNDYESGRFELLNSEEMLLELKTFVENLELDGTIFRANHASNYLPLKGRFPKDKERLLRELDDALTGKSRLRPEFLRGL